ncbi:MAG: DNA-binding response regulator VicR [Candidatus Saccharibacteria bacterium]|nr:DNA-binding response regulator VicR [Candidatus Saccharibacteria bacterium]
MFKLLIVEDDASIREAFSIILKLNDTYDVTTADNGQVALDLCNENTYNIILLDIMMPIMDGPTFLKEYLKLYPNDVTKIIIMSNLSSGSELSILRDYGVDRFVLKSSLTPQKLMDTVAEVLQQRNKTKQQISHTNDDKSSTDENNEQSVGKD